MDRDIAKREHERQVWRQSALTTFFFPRGWAHLIRWEQARELFRWFPRIIDTASRYPQQAAFLVPVRFSGTGTLDPLP